MIAAVYKDRAHFDIEGYVNFGAKKFELLPDGNFKPIVFKRYRNISEEYEGYVEYTSGIMGRIDGKQRLAFYYKKERSATPPKKN